MCARYDVLALINKLLCLDKKSKISLSLKIILPKHLRKKYTSNITKAIVENSSALKTRLVN